MEKKNVRLVAGIILHPVRKAMALWMRSTYQSIIQRNVRMNWHWKNYDRMHYMTEIITTNCGHTHSELYHNMDRVPGLEDVSGVRFH